jgi:phosphatidylethanolamine-binding protein (PEBP) family uncharacterized protein
MQVYFPSNGDYKKLKEIKNGETLTKEEASFHPVFVINNTNASTLVLYDETAHYLHLLAHGELNHGKKVEELVSYQGPNPPPGTGVHKYTFLLYFTRGNRQQVEANKRANFNLAKFEKENQLIPITSLSFLTTF